MAKIKISEIDQMTFFYADFVNCSNDVVCSSCVILNAKILSVLHELVVNLLQSLHMLRYVMLTERPMPAILDWCELVSMTQDTLSPIEVATESMSKKNSSMKEVIAKYRWVVVYWFIDLLPKYRCVIVYWFIDLLPNTGGWLFIDLLVICSTYSCTIYFEHILQ